MAASPLKVWREKDGRLLRLRLATPKANIVDGAMNAAIKAALIEAEDDPHLRAVLLDHEGPHFSFGASVQEHLPDQCRSMIEGFHAFLKIMVAFPLPILVAVKGQCLGGGLEVAAAGHLMFVSPDSRLGQPEIQLAVFAPAASCLLPERMHRPVAEDMLYSGRSLTGAEAVAAGLANAVADDPEAAALAYYDSYLAKHSAVALRVAVKAARADMVERVVSKFGVVETLYLSGLMKAKDPVEGLTAFLEKRPARWEDR